MCPCGSPPPSPCGSRHRGAKVRVFARNMRFRRVLHVGEGGGSFSFGTYVRHARCSVLQCAAVRCSVEQCAVLRCGVLQCVVCFSVV